MCLLWVSPSTYLRKWDFFTRHAIARLTFELKYVDKYCVTLEFHHNYWTSFSTKFAEVDPRVTLTWRLCQSTNAFESSCPPSLPSALASWVKVRLLPQTDSPRPLPLAQTLLADVVWRSRVIDTTIIPNGEIVDVVPTVTDLQVMILHNQADEPVQEVLGLVVGQPVDVLDVVAHGEHGLPARHGVGAHYRVDGFEYVADVLGGSSGRREELEVVLLGGCVEVWLGVVCRERVEEAPECGRDAVVELVP